MVIEIRLESEVCEFVNQFYIEISTRPWHKIIIKKFGIQHIQRGCQTVVRKLIGETGIEAVLNGNVGFRRIVNTISFADRDVVKGCDIVVKKISTKTTFG